MCRNVSNPSKRFRPEPQGSIVSSAGQMLVAHTEEFLYTMVSNLNDRPPRPEEIPNATALSKRYDAFVTADLNTYATIVRRGSRRTH